jgi:hypothetical protein
LSTIDTLPTGTLPGNSAFFLLSVPSDGVHLFGDTHLPPPAVELSVKVLRSLGFGGRLGQSIENKFHRAVTKNAPQLLLQ